MVFRPERVSMIATTPPWQNAAVTIRLTQLDRERLSTPCLYCDEPLWRHGRRFVQVIGWHEWVAPHYDERNWRSWDENRRSERVRMWNRGVNRAIELGLTVR